MLNRLLLFVFLFAAAAPAFAQADAIERMLRARDAEIKALVGTGGAVPDAQRDRLRAVVNDAIDFEAMSRQALGEFWDDLSATQRTDFVDAFGEVVRAQSLADLDLYRARVTYGDVDVDGATAVAHTTVRSGDVDAAVDYALARRGDTWVVTDLVIDGTSTVAGYANSFQRVMRRQGVEAGYERLLESLRKRAAR